MRRRPPTSIRRAAGTPLRFWAPPVRCLRFSATCRTIDKNTSVIIVAARPDMRAATRPSRVATTMPSRARRATAASGSTRSRGSPTGHWGSAPTCGRPARKQGHGVLAAMLAMPRWPNDNTPVLPMKTWKPTHQHHVDEQVGDRAVAGGATARCVEHPCPEHDHQQRGVADERGRPTDAEVERSPSQHHTARRSER